MTLCQAHYGVDLTNLINDVRKELADLPGGGSVWETFPFLPFFWFLFVCAFGRFGCLLH